MNRTEAKEFMKKIQTTSSIALHSAVIFYYDQFTRMTAQRNILSTDINEVDDWFWKVVTEYKKMNFTFVGYIDGYIKESNHGHLGSTLALFQD